MISGRRPGKAPESGSCRSSTWIASGPYAMPVWLTASADVASAGAGATVVSVTTVKAPAITMPSRATRRFMASLLSRLPVIGHGAGGGFRANFRGLSNDLRWGRHAPALNVRTGPGQGDRRPPGEASVHGPW